MNKIILFFLLALAPTLIRAQEFNARVSVVSSRVSNSADKKALTTLQTALNDFVNNRKWSNETYAANEKIACNFLLNVEATGDPNVYTASLMIQSGRPVFNTSYISPIINYQDKDVTFKYVEFQQLEFNDNRVSGTDPLVSNLTAVFAYWINMILGFDHDSFSPKGGDPYFQKAQNIVNNAPEGRNISGWKPFDGTRNRYWLAENLLNSKYTIFHDAMYNYYRMGMDKLYDQEATGRQNILNVLTMLNTFNIQNPNTMILQFFFQAKTQELIQVFLKASPPDKAKALEYLKKLDVSSATKYEDELK